MKCNFEFIFFEVGHLPEKAKSNLDPLGSGNLMHTSNQKKILVYNSPNPV
jgi:hypothetical protein